MSRAARRVGRDLLPTIIASRAFATPQKVDESFQEQHTHTHIWNAHNASSECPVTQHLSIEAFFQRQRLSKSKRYVRLSPASPILSAPLARSRLFTLGSSIRPSIQLLSQQAPCILENECSRSRSRELQNSIDRADQKLTRLASTSSSSSSSAVCLSLSHTSQAASHDFRAQRQQRDARGECRGRPARCALAVRLCMAE